MSNQRTEAELAAPTPLERCRRQTPISTQISSDELCPDRQNERQRQVEARLRALVDDLDQKRGMDRRKFFQTAGGVAAALVANEVCGNLFDVGKVEAATPAMAQPALYITAAIQWSNGKAQFFLNDGRYFRYDMQADRMDPGYPKPIDDKTWPGMGRYSFALSSALNWKDGKIQFFLKNGQYIRYDVANDRADEGYPKNVTESSWPGLESYKDNLAGMINWNNGKAYMFLNNGWYLRYDIQADRTDPGYPKPIDDGNWPGMGAGFRGR